MKRTLIFFLDAVRYEYLERGFLPYLAEIGQVGKSYRLQTVLAFEGIAATAYTGVYPSQHSIWTQFVLDEGGQFNWLKRYLPIIIGLDKAMGVSRTSRKVFRHLLLRFSNLRGQLEYYPSVNEIPLNLLPKFGVAIRKNLLTTDDINGYTTFLSVLLRNGIGVQVIDHPMLGSDWDVVRDALKVKDPKDVTLFRMWDLDSITHSNGTSSTKTLKAIRDTDERVRMIVQHFNRVLGEDVNIFVFADHGMMDVADKVDLARLLREEGLELGVHYLAFFDSTIARFWGDDQAITGIRRILQSSGQGRVLTQQDYKTFQIPEHERYGKLIFLTDPGKIILPNFYQGRRPVAAMHGYDPSTPEMDTIFLTNLKHDGAGRTKVSMADIAPTILASFGLSCPHHVMGQSLLG